MDMFNFSEAMDAFGADELDLAQLMPCTFNEQTQEEPPEQQKDEAGQGGEEAQLIAMVHELASQRETDYGAQQAYNPVP